MKRGRSGFERGCITFAKAEKNDDECFEEYTVAYGDGELKDDMDEYIEDGETRTRARTMWRRS